MYIFVDKDIQKAIKLLEVSADRKFLPASIFLFVINTCYQKDENKAIYYLAQIRDNEKRIFISILISIFLKKDCSQFLKDFIYKYDLVYSFDDNFLDGTLNPKFLSQDFANFLIYETFNSKLSKQKSSKPQKDINNQFYEGFYH